MIFRTGQHSKLARATFLYLLKLHLVRRNNLERKQIESEKSKDTQNTDISKRTK